MTGWELRIWRKHALVTRKAAREFGVTQRTWHARENAEQVDVTVWRTTVHFQSVTCCLTCRDAQGRYHQASGK